jgi:hypothetical protein
MLILHEDGSKVRQAVFWNQATDIWTGVNGERSLRGVSFDELKAKVQEKGLLNTAYVWMVTPVDGKMSPQVAAINGTDNSFTTRDVITNWNTIHELFKKHGFRIVAHTSDGDGRLMTGMLRSIKTHCNLLAELSSKPWYILSPDVIDGMPIFNCQDVVHGVLKLRSSMTNCRIWLVMGNNVASISHVKEAIMSLSQRKRDELGIKLEDLNPDDKQNFPAAQRLCSPKIRTLLMESSRPLLDGTIIYLECMHSLIEPFYNLETDADGNYTMTMLDRIEMLMFPVLYNRIWNRWLHGKKCEEEEEFKAVRQREAMEQKRTAAAQGAAPRKKASQKKGKQSAQAKAVPKIQTIYDPGTCHITENSWQTIELIGHSVIGMVVFLVQSGATEFPIWHLTSQACEKFFRTARTAGPSNTSRMLFSLGELLDDVSRMQSTMGIKLKGDVKFPAHKKHRSNYDEVSISQPGIPVAGITLESIDWRVRKAFTKAKAAAEKVGMSTNLNVDSDWASLVRPDLIKPWKPQKDDRIAPLVASVDAGDRIAPVLEPILELQSIAEVTNLHRLDPTLMAVGDTVKHKSTTASQLTHEFRKEQSSRDRNQRVKGFSAPTKNVSMKNTMPRLERGDYVAVAFEDCWKIGCISIIYLEKKSATTENKLKQVAYFLLDTEDTIAGTFALNFLDQDSSDKTTFVDQQGFTPKDYHIRESLLMKVDVRRAPGTDTCTITMDSCKKIEEEFQLHKDRPDEWTPAWSRQMFRQR